MKTNINLWPFSILAAFGLFFIGMASVVVIASTHREHLVSDNYYEQELKFQGQIDANARARKSGAMIASEAADGAVVVSLPKSQLAQNPAGTIKFYRPSSPALDREISLAPRPDGTQTVDVSRFAAGPWLVRLEWNASGEAYFLEQKITLAPK